MTDVLPESLIRLSDRRASGNGYRPPDFEVRDSIPAFPLTDPGNAQRMEFWEGRNLLYCPTWGQWLVWDQVRHARDTLNSVMHLATTVADRMYLEVQQEQDEARRAAIAKHAQASQAISRLKAMIELTQSRPGIAVEPELFDADPWLLNVQNGTIDLRNGTLRPHRREDYITKLAPVLYDPHAVSPVWDAFLQRVLPNPAVVSFVKRAVGYSATGLTVEEILLLLFGTGRNGKSKFLSAIQYTLGDYAQSTLPETLMVKREGHIPNDIAALMGARFVITTEVEDGARMAESLVKRLTGGDMMTARFMRGEYFDFKPTSTIWIAGNHDPVIRGTDLAMWERILKVPFTVTIPAAERDKALSQKLEAESSGILRWIVEGCLEWQQHGLAPPPEVQAATAEYRDEMDILARFIEDCCVEYRTAVTPTGQLYDCYEEWCKDVGERQWSQQLLGRKLHERGHVSDRNGKTRVWQGIGLRVEA